MAPSKAGFGDETEAEMLEDSDWEPISEDEGEPVNLANESPFIGTYLGAKEVMVTDDNGDSRAVQLMLFEDQNGKKRSIWRNFRLEQAMEGVSKGTVVKIVHHGKKDIGNGRTLNRISVYQAKK